MKLSGMQMVRATQTAPLSFAQQRLWFLDQYEPENILYNIPAAIRLKGDLNVTALEQSLSEILRRHETLRTTFAIVDDRPVQVIHEARDFRLPVIELRENQQAAAQFAAEEARKPFDLSAGPLLRVKLLRLTDDDHVLLITMHHIISDGWSIKVLIRELSALYEAYTNGQPAALPELPIQYADFATWQREWLQGERLEEQLFYWREQLAGSLPLLELPTDRPRPNFKTIHGADVRLNLSSSLSKEITQLGRREGTTLFMTLLSVFYVLLYRYTNQEDILFGTPIANRNRAETESLIGFFVNTLILRAHLSDTMTFRELLRQIRETSLEAYAHQDLPFEKLVEELQPERALSHSPLVQVMFHLQNAVTERLSLSGLSTSELAFESETAKFDLSLSMAESEECITGTLNYNTDLFDAASVERMARHFERLLNAVVSNPDEQVCRLQMLSPAERYKVLFEWNEPHRDFRKNSKDRPVHLAFAAQARRTPEAIAVRFEHDELTYRELNRRANRLAHRLRRLGVGPEVRVGLLVRRSVELIVAMLATLKAGGAYVPLDPDYPRERLAFMLDTAQCGVLVTKGVTAEGLAGEEHGRVLVDTADPTIESESDADPTNYTDAENAAYVMFTSGSTGTPKGIVIPHRAINHLVGAGYVELGPSNCMAQASNTAFDATTFEVWGALLSGAQLVGLPLDVILSPNDFAEEIRRQHIGTIFLTAALFNQIARELPEAFAPLDLLLFGGEAADPSAVRQVLDKGRPRRLLNAYGPTECTTFAAWQLVEEVSRATIPIGRGIANTRLYILDRHMRPVPIGVTGELHIGGDGLARGYLDRPGLTAERFVPDPFGSEPGRRLYKTGDLARWLANGQVEFIGRNDFQVKVRGFRIELGEIETVLRGHDDVREAVVTAYAGNEGDTHLAAYVVANGPAPARSDLRAFLKEKLPDYMLPQLYDFLDKLPLTAHGKVDRRALPQPEGVERELESPFVAPGNAVEEVLCEIFAEVLSVARVGVHDNFFELGGHSLLATQLVSRVRKTFQAELALRKIFEAPTVATLGALLVAGEPSPGEFERRAATLRTIETLSTDDLEELLRRKKTKAAS